MLLCVLSFFVEAPQMVIDCAFVLDTVNEFYVAGKKKSKRTSNAMTLVTAKSAPATTAIATACNCKNKKKFAFFNVPRVFGVSLVEDSSDPVITTLVIEISNKWTRS